MLQVLTCYLLELYFGGQFHYGNQEQCGVFGDEGLLYTLASPLTIISILNMTFFVATIRWLPPAFVLCRPAKPAVKKEALPDVPEAAEAEANSGEAIKTPEQVSACQAPGFQSGYQSSTLETVHPPVSLKTDNANLSDGGPAGIGGQSKVEWRSSKSEKPQLPTHGPVVTCGSDKQVKIMSSVRHLSQRQVWAYVRMSVMLSISWLSGFLSVFTQQYWMWILFVTVNSLQGILVFVSLVLNGAVLSLFLDRFRFRATTCEASKSSGESGGADMKSGPYTCNLPVISDGYVLLDESTDIVFMQ